MADQKSLARCPICQTETDRKFRPFCSKRCADIDLGKWLNNSYVLPDNPDWDEDGDEAPDLKDLQKEQDV